MTGRRLAFVMGTLLGGSESVYALITAVSNRKEQEIACLRAWSESAPYWDKYACVIPAMFEPLSDALIEDAAGSY
jgi:hypothetical protein